MVKSQIPMGSQESDISLEASLTLSEEWMGGGVKGRGECEEGTEWE